MSTPTPQDLSANHRAQAWRMLWPVAVATFLFTVSYPANDFVGPPSDSDIGVGLFLVYCAIAAITGGVVFGLVLPWGFRREGSGGVALALAIPGAVLAPGFWTGVPPGLAAGGALLGWAGLKAAKARRLSQLAFVIGVLGAVFNVTSYAEVFI